MAKPPLPLRRAFLTIFLIALVIRSAWLGLVSCAHNGVEVVRLFPDSARYDALARWLLGEEWRYPADMQMLANDPSYRSGEGAMLYGAPAYPAFLAAIYRVTGASVWIALAVQAVLSALGCLLTGVLAWQLTGSARVALGSGILASVSLTSCALAAALTTECLFYFLFVAAIVSGVAALRGGHWVYWMLHGASLASATLVKPVLQFWPLLTVLVCLGLWGINRGDAIRPRLLRAMLWMVVPIAAAGGWAWRNYERDGVFSVAEMGTSSARWMWCARAAVELEPGRNIQDIQRQWRANERMHWGGATPPLSETHRREVRAAWDMLRAHPAAMARAYAVSVVQNCIAPDDLHVAQAPQLGWLWRRIDSLMRRAVVPGLVVAFVIAACALVVRRNAGAGGAVLLAGIYGYFAAFSGVAYWQGSRYLYPADVAVWIALAWAGSAAWARVRGIRTSAERAGRR